MAVRAATDTLNEGQRAVVEHDDRPLLVVAGAGLGKRQELAPWVSTLIPRGADRGRILLLTFTRRAAAEMTRRVSRICGSERNAGLIWAGTFHAMANRLLRMHAASVGLDPGFTLLDREDSADLIDRVRQEHGFSGTRERFPRKGTCLAIYSRVVNTQASLRACLEE